MNDNTWGTRRGTEFIDRVPRLLNNINQSLEELIEIQKSLTEPKKSEPEYVYVYKAYNDGLAYGEEYIQLFRDEADAIAFLNAHVREAYGDVPCVLSQDPEFEDDLLDEKSVIIRNDGGDTSYFLIDKLPIN